MATFKRDLEKLRSNFNAPIIYDHDSGGYKFDKPNAGKKFELPGMWFDESEATALVLMQHLLSGLDQGGLIGPHIAPLMSRIDAILGNGETPSKELRKRIKVLGMGSRKTPIKNFADIGRALLNRNRIQIGYYARSTDQESEREISPQSLIYYRDNWYLDAYCHLRNDLRSFAVPILIPAYETSTSLLKILKLNEFEFFIFTITSALIPSVLILFNLNPLMPVHCTSLMFTHEVEMMEVSKMEIKKEIL